MVRSGAIQVTQGTVRPPWGCDDVLETHGGCQRATLANLSFSRANGNDRADQMCGEKEGGVVGLASHVLYSNVTHQPQPRRAHLEADAPLAAVARPALPSLAFPPVRPFLDLQSPPLIESNQSTERKHRREFGNEAIYRRSCRQFADVEERGSSAAARWDQRTHSHRHRSRHSSTVWTKRRNQVLPGQSLQRAVPSSHSRARPLISSRAAASSWLAHHRGDGRYCSRW